MKTCRWKITSFTACCVLAMAFSACSAQTTTTTATTTATTTMSTTPAGTPSAATTTSPAGTGTPSAGRASLDPALVSRLGAAPWARAIVMVTLDGAVPPSLGATLPDGISSGPYAAAKSAALARAGAGVRLVRDHSALASMVVEFETVAAAKALAADPNVVSVTADRTRTVLPQPTMS